MGWTGEHRYLSVHEQWEILRLFAEGSSAEDISRFVGRQIKTIYRVLERGEIRPGAHPRRFSLLEPADVSRAVLLRHSVRAYGRG